MCTPPTLGKKQNKTNEPAKMLEDCDYAVTQKPQPRKLKFFRTCVITFIYKEIYDFPLEKKKEKGG